jgi:hypothetical protein
VHFTGRTTVGAIGATHLGTRTSSTQLVAASMPQHMRVNLEAEPSFDTGALDHLGKARLRKRPPCRRG